MRKDINPEGQLHEGTALDAINWFWANQAQSLNRDSGAGFYSRKASEHASILSEQDARRGILDLGCGAGELLEYLAVLVKVKVALDYSASMLDAARQRLGEFADLELVQADIFEYLPTTDLAVWMTTGAINQYLDSQDLRRVLEFFTQNAVARSLYLFDCIDPLRYQLLLHGISYRPEHLAASLLRRRLKGAVRRLITAAKFGFGVYSRDVQYLGSPGMGYGQLPRFWLAECMSRQLSVEVVSSRYYEYRYHVRITKDVLGAAEQS